MRYSATSIMIPPTIAITISGLLRWQLSTYQGLLIKKNQIRKTMTIKRIPTLTCAVIVVASCRRFRR